MRPRDGVRPSRADLVKDVAADDGHGCASPGREGVAWRVSVVSVRQMFAEFEGYGDTGEDVGCECAPDARRFRGIWTHWGLNPGPPAC